MRNKYSALSQLSALVIVLAGGMSVGLHAQAMSAGASFVLSQDRGISATGHAKIYAKPDIAYISISVTTQAREPADATSANASNTNALLRAIHGAGISDSEIQTSSYSVQPQYDYEAHPPALTGFQVTNSVRVTVHDLTRVGIVIDKAASAGATEVSDVTFDIADRSAVEQEALKAAVADAKHRAQAMAAAAGASLVQLIRISDGASPQATPFPMQPRMAMAAGAATTPIAPQQIEIDQDATVLYGFAEK